MRTVNSTIVRYESKGHIASLGSNMLTLSVDIYDYVSRNILLSVEKSLVSIWHIKLNLSLQPHMLLGSRLSIMLVN